MRGLSGLAPVEVDPVIVNLPMHRLTEHDLSSLIAFFDEEATADAAGWRSMGAELADAARCERAGRRVLREMDLLRYHWFRAVD